MKVPASRGPAGPSRSSSVTVAHFGPDTDGVSAWKFPPKAGSNIRPAASSKFAGTVRIGSLVDGRIVWRRVSVAPAFDPNATSMTPLLGWRAASIPARKAA